MSQCCSRRARVFACAVVCTSPLWWALPPVDAYARGVAATKASNKAASARAAATTTKLAMNGLGQPVEILTDRWGVPHIYASTLDDAFFAQGYQAARDRLWQMDLWRKRGLGEMARDFGPAYVEGDRMARAVLYRGDLYREWLAYGSDGKRIAEAFVAGVNAFVTQSEAHPEMLSEEFRLLGYKPAKWNAPDVVRIRHHGLTLNFTSEVDRAADYCAGIKGGSDATQGPKIDWLRRELAPPVQPVVPDGLDLCGLPTAELKAAYALATAIPRFTKEMLQRAAIVGCTRQLVFGSSEQRRSRCGRRSRPRSRTLRAR